MRLNRDEAEERRSTDTANRFSRGFIGVISTSGARRNFVGKPSRKIEILWIVRNEFFFEVGSFEGEFKITGDM